MMSTVMSIIIAYGLTAISLAIGAAFDAPWQDIILTVPVIIMLAVITSTDNAVRFAVFCGVFQSICFPSQNPLISLTLVTVAMTSSFVYRAIFSIPSTGALLTTAIAGSMTYEIGLYILKARTFYEIGFPGWVSLMGSAGIRLMMTMVIVLIGGALYRNAVVRFRQAFVKTGTGI